MGTLTIAKNSRFMRFFLWVWKVDPSTLNICKLFWGTLFFPIGLLRPTAARIGAGVNFFAAALNLATVAYRITEGHFSHITMINAIIIPINIVCGMFCLSIGKMSRERKLGVVTSTSTIFDRLFDRFLGRPADFISDVCGNVGESRVAGWMAVVVHYVHSVKERTCLSVRVV